MATAYFRDVFFADLRDPATELGGLVATPGVTNANFYTIVKIALSLPAVYSLQDSDGQLLPHDNSQLLPGYYLILSDVAAIPSTARYFTRAQSITTGTRLESFKREVRERDGRCVISKVESLGPLNGDWTGFEAAHIVPLAYANEWRNRGFANLVTIPPPHPRQADTINSVQNGLLMQNNFHALFDGYRFSILPKDGYKIIFFAPDRHGLAGTHLDRRLLDDDRRPLDAFLQWHFEQAVLCNVRGAGEPIHDFDYPPGSDMMGDILSGPKAAERMQFELYTRLGASLDLPLDVDNNNGGNSGYNGNSGDNYQDDDNLSGAAYAAAQHGSGESLNFFVDILQQIGGNKSYQQFFGGGGMAMSEASKQSAVQKAGEVALQMHLKSQGGGSSSSGSGVIGSLLSMASKFM